MGVTSCIFVEYSGPRLERPSLPPGKSGFSKGVASQEGDILMHFLFCSRKEVASHEGVASREGGAFLERDDCSFILLLNLSW
jgi:hypothetical protein